MMFLANIWVLIFDDFLLSQHHLDHIGYILFYYLYEVPTYYLEKCKKNPLPTLGQRQFFYKTNIKCKGCLLFGSNLQNFWVLCSLIKKMIKF